METVKRLVVARSYQGGRDEKAEHTGFLLNYSEDTTGFPGGLVVKNPPANAGDAGLIPGLERSPGEGNGNLLQYSCLENPMDRRTWRATVHRVAIAHRVTKELGMT